LRREISDGEALRSLIVAICEGTSTSMVEGTAPLNNALTRFNPILRNKIKEIRERKNKRSRNKSPKRFSKGHFGGGKNHRMTPTSILKVKKRFVHKSKFWNRGRVKSEVCTFGHAIRRNQIDRPHCRQPISLPLVRQIDRLNEYAKRSCNDICATLPFQAFELFRSPPI
jgi:hypothetical protein